MASYAGYDGETETTLTIRLPQKQRDALRRRAVALRKTESEIVRQLIERETKQSSLRERIGSLIGSLDSASSAGPPHPLKAIIRERDWRKLKARCSTLVP